MVIEEEELRWQYSLFKNLFYFMSISICLDVCAWCQGGQKKTDILKLMAESHLAGTRTQTSDWCQNKCSEFESFLQPLTHPWTIRQAAGSFPQYTCCHSSISLFQPFLRRNYQSFYFPSNKNILLPISPF